MTETGAFRQSKSSYLLFVSWCSWTLLDPYLMVYEMTVALSPSISLWPLGGVVFVVEDGDVSADEVSNMRFPQSMWLPCMTMVFSISVFCMVVGSRMHARNIM